MRPGWSYGLVLFSRPFFTSSKWSWTNDSNQWYLLITRLLTNHRIAPTTINNNSEIYFFKNPSHVLSDIHTYRNALLRYSILALRLRHFAPVFRAIPCVQTADVFQRLVVEETYFLRLANPRITNDLRMVTKRKYTKSGGQSTPAPIRYADGRCGKIRFKSTLSRSVDNTRIMLEDLSAWRQPRTPFRKPVKRTVSKYPPVCARIDFPNI